MGTVDLTSPGKFTATHFDKEKRPKVAWTQTDESLSVILRVPDSKDPQAKVLQDRLDLSVAGPDGKRYTALLNLKQQVETDVSTWGSSVRRGSVKFTFKKQKEAESEWAQLVTDPPKTAKTWLEYDWDAHDDHESDDVEPDEKEQPDVEPRKRPRFEEPAKEKEVEETKQQKQSKWAEKQAQLEKEAEDIRAKNLPKRSMGLKFTGSQTSTIVAVAVVLTAFFTHLLTKWTMGV